MSQTEGKSIVVMGAARAKGGHENDVRVALHSFIEPSRHEDGCVSYRLFEDVRYTGSFYTVEEWSSQEHLDRHIRNQQPEMNKLLAWLSEELRISVVQETVPSMRGGMRSEK